ncbi:hypothetical protein J2S62_000752 [Enteractinococcus fodinae]|uniref:Uncharacterized protein n=1 Tax=Enteractinococcus fodinae TaxID=684663 RepID=A0ABU2AYR7_9MICC|nr:hypothetical protein [Enteractinococcus fodinae]
MLHELIHLPWHDLPGHPEPIFAPATLFGLGYRRQRLPVVVDFCLVFTRHQQRDRFGERGILVHG